MDNAKKVQCSALMEPYNCYFRHPAVLGDDHCDDLSIQICYDVDVSFEYLFHSQAPPYEFAWDGIALSTSTLHEKVGALP